MINGQNFILDEIPSFHPLSQDYVRFWREEKRKIIEGAWLGGYYIPPSLYFYVNYSTIELNKNRYTNQKIFSRPWLRELEWDIFRGWTVAQGFSGFEDDPTYTSHKEVLDPDVDLDSLKRYLPFVFNQKGELKEYVDPLDYLKQRHPRHFTKPSYTNQVKNYMMMGARDSGKALANYSKLHTPTGTITIGEVKVGDQIYDDSGKLTTVTNVYPQGITDLYRVTLSDGRTVDCSSDHLWTVDDEVKPLKDIDLKDRNLLPKVSPVDFPAKQTTIDPYTLGRSLETSPYSADYFLHSSIEQRIAVIRGVVKSFGSVSQSKIILPNYIDVRSILSSMGITYRKHASITSFTTDIPEILDELGEAAKEITLYNNVYIQNIEKLEDAETTCITVDNESKLFLTEDFVPTHNSYMVGGGMVLHQFLTDNLKIYKQTDEESKVDITIGAEGSEKSKLLIDKIRSALTRLPGAREIGGKYYPSPLSKKIKGSWNLGSEVVAEYKKKVGGEWKDVGSRSKIKHRTFRDDSFKDQGARPSMIVLEEVGLFSNLKEVYYNTKNNLTDGDRKIGSLVMLGCVAAGTKVWTNEGKLINIEDLKKEDGIIGYDNGYSEKDINYINPPANKPSYRITTTGNNIIECSDDHPFFYSERKTRKANILQVSYREAKNLKKGDYLYTLDSVPVFGSHSDPNSYLLGLMLGDGYFKGRSVSVDDEEIYKYVTSTYKTSVRKSFQTKAGENYYDLYIKEASEMFRSWDIVGTKENKALPKDIHLFDKNSLSLVLAGLFDSDGNVYNNAKKNVRIVLSNISKTLLEQVKFYLLKFGIHSNLYKEKRNTPAYVGQKDHIYRLYISKDLDIERFIEQIPIKHTRKLKALDFYKKGNRNFRTAKSVFIHTGEHEDEKFIADKSELQNYRYETIKSVEFIGEQPVYNLNVSGNHTYIASNFITGNTGGDMDKGTIDAAEMFYNPEGYDILPYEDVWEHRGKIGYFIYAPMVLNAYIDEFGKIDYEKAVKAIHKEREKAKKVSSDKLNKEMQYKPLKPSEMFLARTSNVFPGPEIRRRLSEIQTLTSPPYLTVDLFFSPSSSTGVDYSLNETKPLNSFPAKDDESKEGTVVIYELPKLLDGLPPKDLYIIGVDPFKDDHSSNGSLAAVYVLKTSRYPSFGYNEIVASYIGRPFMGKNAVNEIVYKLSLFYGGAKIYFENAVGNVKDYFEKIKRLDLLATQPVTVFNKKASYSTNQPLIYGYPMSNQHIKWEALQYLRSWLLEERGSNDDNIIRNLDLIPDAGLLQELIAFNMDGNFDRVMGLVGCIIGLEETRNLSKRRVEREQSMSDVDKEFERLFVNNKRIFNGASTQTNASLFGKI